jgi:NADH-quinone oxidoreductase subunit L
MVKLAWIVPLVPFLSFLLLFFYQRQLGKRNGWVGTGGTVLATVLAAIIFTNVWQGEELTVQWEWFSIGALDVTAGFAVTPLNSWMLLFVSFISSVVHWYSTAYMKSDNRQGTYFTYLSFFTFAMLALVLSPNVLQLYVFWELVGLGSFLLIGFYFTKEEARHAAKKAFVMTRIGDVGFFVGLVLLFLHVGSFEYDAIFRAVEGGQIADGMVTVIGLLLFFGAIGKSGQFPLHPWLPDAMAGPTPVSALIHAATMVAAGVYMVGALYPVFTGSTVVLATIGTIGTVTLLYGAWLAWKQTDVKRVLAYSTISQLGYMMLALGSVGYGAAMFHLSTHGFFKALLFLAAGMLIHATGTQQLSQMGGLWSSLKGTGILFLIGALALSGVPLLSGFYSKEAIFHTVWEHGDYIWFVLALLTSLLTSLYMFRLFFLAFLGDGRMTAPLRRIPSVMGWASALLAVLAIGSGWLGSPFTAFLTGEAAGVAGPSWLPWVASMFSLGGIGLAYWLYGRRAKVVGVAWTDLLDRWYEQWLVPIVDWKGKIVQRFDDGFVEWIVSSVVFWVEKGSDRFTHWQNGHVQTYGAVAWVGGTIIFAIYLWIGGL